MTSVTEFYNPSGRKIERIFVGKDLFYQKIIFIKIPTFLIFYIHHSYLSISKANYIRAAKCTLQLFPYINSLKLSSIAVDGPKKFPIPISDPRGTGINTTDFCARYNVNKPQMIIRRDN